jgi:hypothetical protein
MRAGMPAFKPAQRTAFASATVKAVMFTMRLTVALGVKM